MSASRQAEYSITLEESRAFAALSGDWNPLHVDPVVARRTQFGGTVVHGIHALLKALDRSVATGQLDALTPPDTIAATFHNPIRTGSEVRVEVSSAAAGKVRVAAAADGRPAFTLTLHAAGATVPTTTMPAPAGERRTAAQARSLSFPPAATLHGTVPVALDPVLFGDLLPVLARTGDAAWLADLVATTRVVGMECPGLDSIYSGFKLQRRPVAAPVAACELSYRIERLDTRFRLARLAVRGIALEGTLDTFFRPPPVSQPSVDEAQRIVSPGAFAGRKALVVGGSRGIGEAAAKLLLAGGADVTVTHASGATDVQRVVDEARQAGLAATPRHLDVNSVSADDLHWLRTTGFSHLLYFASPHIDRNTTGRWNASLFGRYADVYVSGFSRVVEAAAAAASREVPLHVLYPSSVFLDTHEPGFAEYCAAKLAGEELGCHLAGHLPVRVTSPRLPRMRTDQTSALVEVAMEEPMPVLHRLLAGWG